MPHVVKDRDLAYFDASRFSTIGPLLTFAPRYGYTYKKSASNRTGEEVRSL